MHDPENGRRGVVAISIMDDINETSIEKHAGIMGVSNRLKPET